MTDTTNHPSCCCCNRSVLKALDIFISLTWITHLVVATWRGTWNLLDLYVLPGDVISGTWISYFGGILIFTAVVGSYPILHKYIDASQKKTRFIIGHMMLYIATWGTIGQWRGLWSILDRYMDVHWPSNACSLVVTLTLLWLLKASANVLAPPFVADYDLRLDLFVAAPRLKTQPSRYWDYIIDHLLSQLIIESLTVSLWRALWNLLNDLVLPDHYLYSNVVTWSAGLTLALLLFTLEKPLSLLNMRSAFGCRLLTENILTLLAFAATVAMWRGWWNILEGILLTDKFYGGLLCHFAGAFLLFCTSAMSPLVNIDVVIDGESESGVPWNVTYLQKIFPAKSSSSLSSTPSDRKQEENNNKEQENLFRHSANGNYIKCSTLDLEYEHLTSV